jgi:hypothetical protein
MRRARLSILSNGKLELLASRRVIAVCLNGSRVLELLQPLQQRGRVKPFVVAKAHPLPAPIPVRRRARAPPSSLNHQFLLHL